MELDAIIGLAVLALVLLLLSGLVWVSRSRINRIDEIGADSARKLKAELGKSREK